VLSKVIEGEIIPRLFLAHNDIQARQAANKPAEALIPLGDSETFARLVLISDTQEIVAQVYALLDRGVKLERIYLDLLAPVARLLGVMWEEDRCTFTDVTLGVARLHQVLHEIGRRTAGGTRVPVAKRRAFFAATPGEQHTFGLSMLEEFFLHAGWETASDHAASESSIMRSVAAESFDLIGFTVGCKEFLEPLSALIGRVRAASRNPEAVIMVGGRLFLDEPRLAKDLGADVVACDGVHAVQIAERLVSQISRTDTVKTLM
jgi:methanogenic corrinoid protein MtbC1